MEGVMDVLASFLSSVWLWVVVGIGGIIYLYTKYTRGR